MFEGGRAGRGRWRRGRSVFLGGAEVSFARGRSVFSQGAEVSFRKGAEVAGAEVVGAEVSNPQ